MTTLNLLALSNTDALVLISCVAGAAAVLMALFWPRRAIALPSAGAERLDAIEDDLALIRADLADIKESLAELDRLFKSVG